MKSFDELLAEVLRVGIVASQGGLELVTAQARVRGWKPAGSRVSAPYIEILTPTREDEAHRRSISALYGTGRQPLHTDGAHHPRPPRILLLSTEQVSTVSTRVWAFDKSKFTPSQLHDLCHGLFTVKTGSSAFLAPAYANGRLRFDPVCMEPADPRARRTADLLRRLAEDATSFHWNEPGRVLALDNHRCLHGRDDASAEPTRAIQRVALQVNEGRP